MSDGPERRATTPPASLRPVSFDALRGWAGDDHAAAFAAFRRSALLASATAPKTRALGIAGAAIAAAARDALALGLDPGPKAARAFFERAFRPFEVRPESGGGFFTGYYEPEVEGSPVRTPLFTVPLYARPTDLVDVDDDNRPAGLDPYFRFGIRTPSGIAAYHDRAAIEAGALAGRGLELAWLADPVDAFFIHVQGSARVRMPDGTVRRLTYAAKSGHPYTSIGKVLVERGVLALDEVSMATIRDVLAADAAAGRRIMQENRSFIFFREAPVEDPALGPVAAAGAPLTPGRSLAVDRLIHSFHAPVWIETAIPSADGPLPFRRLMVAQDTGSAIVGPARADIFFGSGEAAGALAGEMRGEGRFVVLAPAGAPPGRAR